MKALTPVFLTVLVMGAAQAGPLFSLSPSDGVISGAPGQTVGWGFDLTGFQLSDNSTDWITITSAFILTDSNPELGSFTDFISPQGGPDSGALPPDAPDWTQSFDPVAFTGFGSYAIDPLSSIGDSDTGTFLVEYETFTDNPVLCGGACFDSSGEFFQDFTVNVVAPEPASGITALIGVASILLSARRKRCQALLAGVNGKFWRIERWMSGGAVGKRTIFSIRRGCGSKLC